MAVTVLLHAAVTILLQKHIYLCLYFNNLATGIY